MLLNFTDAQTGNAIAVNPEHVVCVFITKEEEVDKTIINMLNGNVVVTDGFNETVGRIQGVLNTK